MPKHPDVDLSDDWNVQHEIRCIKHVGDRWHGGFGHINWNESDGWTWSIALCDCQYQGTAKSATGAERKIKKAWKEQVVRVERRAATITT